MITQRVLKRKKTIISYLFRDFGAGRFREALTKALLFQRIVKEYGLEEKKGNLTFYAILSKEILMMENRVNRAKAELKAKIEAKHKKEEEKEA